MCNLTKQKNIGMKTFSALILSLFLIGCQPYESPVDKVLKENTGLTNFQNKWIQMKSNCNKLVFKKYYLPDSTISRDLKSIVWADSTVNLRKIERFSQLFTNIKDGGYCCCP